MTTNKDLIIAIDGHSSTGKSTVAKELAKKLNFSYIDTGAMYRCVTLLALENNLVYNGKINLYQLQQKLSNIEISFRYNDETKMSETWMNERNVENEIRSLQVSDNVSAISTLKFVRQHLVSLQQRMGESKRLVMDGRDIGTVVFPDADLKIFMTADVQVRAKRRYDELSAKGEFVTLEEVFENVQKRDLIDSTRAESPLKQAEDAIVLDNSNMTREQQLQWILDKVEAIN